MKITLRELFLLILVVGLALSWWLDRSRLASQNKRLDLQEATARRAAIGFGFVLREKGYGPEGDAFGMNTLGGSLQELKAEIESR